MILTGFPTGLSLCHCIFVITLRSPRILNADRLLCLESKSVKVGRFSVFYSGVGCTDLFILHMDHEILDPHLHSYSRSPRVRCKSPPPLRLFSFPALLSLAGLSAFFSNMSTLFLLQDLFICVSLCLGLTCACAVLRPPPGSIFTCFKRPFSHPYVSPFPYSLSSCAILFLSSTKIPPANF